MIILFQKENKNLQQQLNRIEAKIDKILMIIEPDFTSEDTSVRDMKAKVSEAKKRIPPSP